VDSLTYLDPSEREGNKLPGSPASGEASLRTVDVVPRDSGLPAVLSERRDRLSLGVLARDNPGPAWVAREGGAPLLITPGAEIDAPAIRIYEVDPRRGHVEEAARIDRLSYTPILAVQAVVVGGRLFVAWLEPLGAASTIRMAVVPEP
jgi:hypothetical protein